MLGGSYAAREAHDVTIISVLFLFSHALDLICFFIFVFMAVLGESESCFINSANHGNMSCFLDLGLRKITHTVFLLLEMVDEIFPLLELLPLEPKVYK